ncbi:TetR-like C-terminal domain-containing protein [Yinghuangia aomiensis]
MEGVARRAGVSRPTIYQPLADQGAPRPRGRLPGPGRALCRARRRLRRVDRRARLHRRHRTLRGGRAGVVPASGNRLRGPRPLADYRDQPELREALNTRLDAVRAAFRDLVDAAVARGQARPDLDADLLYDTLSAVSPLLHTEQQPPRLDPASRAPVAELVVHGAGSSPRRTDHPANPPRQALQSPHRLNILRGA